MPSVNRASIYCGETEKIRSSIIMVRMIVRYQRKGMNYHLRVIYKGKQIKDVFALPIIAYSLLSHFPIDINV